MIHVRQLTDQTGQSDYPHPFLLCLTCGERNSAHAGDYFAVDPNHVFRHCGRDMILVRQREVLEWVDL